MRRCPVAFAPVLVLAVGCGFAQVGCGFANFKGAISLASDRANVRTTGAFSPDGRRFAVVEARLSGAREEVSVLRVYRRGPTPDLPAQWRLAMRVHLRDLLAVEAVFSPDGHTLALAGLARAHNNVALWDVRTGRLRRVVAGSAPLTQALAFSPDGRALVTAGIDGVIRVFDAQDGAQRFAVREDPGLLKQARFPLVVAHDGAWLAYGRSDGRVAFAGLDSGAVLRVADTGAREVLDLARSTDGRYLAAATDAGLLLWDLREPAGRARRVSVVAAQAIAFAPDARDLLLSDAADGQARVLTLPEGRTAYGYQEPMRKAASPASPSTPKRVVRAWSRLARSFPHDALSGPLRDLLSSYLRARVHRVAFSPENLWIAFFEQRHAGLIITQRHYELRRSASRGEGPPKGLPPAPAPSPPRAPGARVEGSI